MAECQRNDDAPQPRLSRIQYPRPLRRPRAEPIKAIDFVDGPGSPIVKNVKGRETWATGNFRQITRPKKVMWPDLQSKEDVEKSLLSNFRALSELH